MHTDLYQSNSTQIQHPWESCNSLAVGQNAARNNSCETYGNYLMQMFFLPLHLKKQASAVEDLLKNREKLNLVAGLLEIGDDFSWHVMFQDARSLFGGEGVWVNRRGTWCCFPSSPNANIWYANAFSKKKPTILESHWRSFHVISVRVSRESLCTRQCWISLPKWTTRLDDCWFVCAMVMPDDPSHSCHPQN